MPKCLKIIAICDFLIGRVIIIHIFHYLTFTLLKISQLNYVKCPAAKSKENSLKKICEPVVKKGVFLNFKLITYSFTKYPQKINDKAYKFKFIHFFPWSIIIILLENDFLIRNPTFILREFLGDFAAGHSPLFNWDIFNSGLKHLSK